MTAKQKHKQKRAALNVMKSRNVFSYIVRWQYFSQYTSFGSFKQLCETDLNS